jgi:hypothetical protein
MEQLNQYTPGSSNYFLKPYTSPTYTPNAALDKYTPQSPSYFMKPQPQILSGATQTTTNTGTGSGSVGTFSDPNQQQVQQPSGPSAEDLMRQQIESGYNEWEGGMNSVMGELPNQAAAQNQMIGSQYQQGYNTLTNQLGQGQDLLNNQRTKTETTQTKNLGSLAESLRNQFLQGQVMLGQRGAGDSSAANQYSYALSKLGSKERSSIMNTTAEIMGEIGQRESNLKRDYDTGIQNLSLERDNKMAQVAQWLSEQQNAVRAQIADGKLRKSSEISAMSQNFLNQAIQAMQQVRSEFTARQNALQEWAMANSQTINQLKSNLGQVANYAPQQSSFNGIFGQPTMDAAGNIMARYGGSYSTDDEKRY